ncbi:MAG TPA: hypothetical protein VMR18_00030 [Candidatus Saccharimonadales bacterium]|nr:hypothetical protein [Candidatus Saccharimonadales bacterium]
MSATVFAENPEARELHETGLWAAQNGSFSRAHRLFSSAQEFLVGDTLGIAVQSARIARDDGFTYVRSAIAESNLGDLDKADNALEVASGKTFVKILSAGELPKVDQAYRELAAEHGATISLIGRLSTVRLVMAGPDREEPIEDVYSAAHSALVIGNNGYYRVSNAMVAARHERLFGRPDVMVRWLSKAAVGWSWTLLHDPSNLEATTRTATSRTRHLRNRTTAIESVKSKP